MMKTVASAELRSTAAVLTVGHFFFYWICFGINDSNFTSPESYKHHACTLWSIKTVAACMYMCACACTCTCIWCSFGARVQVKSPETTARWCGVSAHTASTCTASWSGWTRSRCSSSAPCAGRSGSLKSEDLAVRLVLHFN